MLKMLLGTPSQGKYLLVGGEGALFVRIYALPRKAARASLVPDLHVLMFDASYSPRNCATRLRSF